MATIDELTPEAQAKALSDFTKFYLDKYRHEGLDLIAQADGAGHVADINAWLVANANFTTAELQAGLLADRGDNIKALLTAIKAPFTEAGLPQTPWDEWFKQSLASIPQGR
ncbi:hypothetical protein [Lacticaseibacillus sp. GG6-2]